jgi:NADH-quinone oxidoreductase subunit N
LYILTGSDKRNLKSNEASLKYFLLGSFSTGLMLMGITLIYGNAGSFSMDVIAESISKPEVKPGILLIAGLLLLMFSMAFKVSAAPFHFWTPDVYDGAPTVFTSFMATIVKAAVFIAFIRLFNRAFGDIHDTWKFIIAVITALTLFIGNITAVFQQERKKNAGLFKYCTSRFYADGCSCIEQHWFGGNITLHNSILSFYHWPLCHFG